MRISAVDRGAVSETMLIFILLNGGQGYTNKHDIEIAKSGNPFDRTSMDNEALARKNLAGAVKTDES